MNSHPAVRTISELNSLRPIKSRLTAVAHADPEINNKGHRIQRVVSICSCGKESVLRVAAFISVAVSCGCSKKERIGWKKKGPSSPYPRKLRVAYHGMINRCYDKHGSSYHNYGGRGVIVCDEWRRDMRAFCDWALINGWQPRLQLDKDINGNGLIYSPSTCCFVTSKENNSHRRNSHRVDYNGANISLVDLSVIWGVSYVHVYNEVARKKQDPERALIGMQKARYNLILSHFRNAVYPEMETEAGAIMVQQLKNKVFKLLADLK